MYYWNQDNFEGLLRVAEALDDEPRLSSLAEYCRLRERGLRRLAFKALSSFLRDSSAWDATFAREATERILRIHAGTSEAHQFVTQPLLAKLIYPVLDAWLRDEPTGYSPLRWLGLLRGDTSLLAAALAQHPDDVPVRRRLVTLALSHVEYATHHLGEGLFLGDLRETQAALSDASAFVSAAPDSRAFDDLREAVTEYEALLRDWQSYSESPQGSFPEWCTAKGRPRAWQAAFYYTK